MRRWWWSALLLVPVTAGAQQPVEQPRTLTVTATASVEREPEQGIVVLAVESEAPTARAAADANAGRMTQLVAALRRAGVPDRSIRTISYELRPEYPREQRGGDPPRIVGYRAINMVQVTVDTVARLGGVIDTSINSGANRVADIRLTLRNAHAAHVEAVALAVGRARAEAEVVASAAGVELGPVLNIHTGGYVPPPMPVRAYGRALDMEQLQVANTPIEGGTLTVTATVNVVYRLGR